MCLCKVACAIASVLVYVCKCLVFTFIPVCAFKRAFVRVCLCKCGSVSVVRVLCLARAYMHVQVRVRDLCLARAYIRAQVRHCKCVRVACAVFLVR